MVTVGWRKRRARLHGLRANGVYLKFERAPLQSSGLNPQVAAGHDQMNGVATLVLTDLVDSTQLNSTLGDDAMAAIWAAHDRAARELIRLHGGREIGRSDGFLVLFDQPARAVAFATDYHGQLAAMSPPLWARVGIHTGAVRLRENSNEDREQGATPFELDGVALPTAARLMGAAGAGQTLISSTARAEAKQLPCRHLSHGHWRFKGVEEPMEVFEVGDQGAPFRPPQDSAKAYRVVRQAGHWLPVALIPRLLPAERDGFVGRRDSLQALSETLASGARLVSIVGAGGAGKTRLAMRYAWEHLGDYPGGVWFCDLAQARSLEGISFAVAQGLQVPLGQAEPISQLGQALAGRSHCLVILDNFEQVARHAEATLGQWIERAAQARFIVTSREVLGIVGEQVQHLAPLSGADGEELFLRRAASARFGYAPSADDRAAIRELVRVLDGLPLAIELAAARVRVISPRVLMNRVCDRFDLISARSGRQDRQLTLRATFDWSWDLLGDREKASLALLSVFQGGFSLDSATAVLPPADDSLSDVVDVVQGLVDKSFVRQISDSRFDLLETVREYAARQLVGNGSFEGSGPAFARAGRQRYCQYFASLQERAATADRCIEANNLVAAARAAAESGDAAVAAACVSVAWSALRLTGPYRVAVELAETVLRLNGLGVREQAVLHWVAGDALDLIGDVKAARFHLQQGMARASEALMPSVASRLLVTLGSRETLDGELEQARIHLEESLRIATELDDAELRMRALNALGLHFDHQSRWPQAQGSYEGALALARSIGDRHMEGGLLGNLGGLHLDMGNLEAARLNYEMSLDVAHQAGDRRWEGNARCNLGMLHQEQGKPAEARTQFATALETARQMGHVRLEYTVLCNLGILLASEDRLEEAGQHFEQAVAAAVACADRRAEGQFRGYLALNQARRGLRDYARDSLDTGEQLLVAMADQLSYALLLCDRAEVEVHGRRHAEARRAFEDARRMADALNCKNDSDLRRRLSALSPMMLQPP